MQKLAWTLADKKHDYAKAEVVVCPPYTDLRSVQTVVDGDRLSIRYGAQDVSTHDEGAYTGEITAAMLKQLATPMSSSATPNGVSTTPRTTPWSTRRQQGGGRRHRPHRLRRRGPGDPASGRPGVLHDSAGRRVAGGLQRRAGRGARHRLQPVWAIGTGEVATPEDAQEVCAAIRARLTEVHGAEVGAAVRILYGGSVKAANVGGIMAQPDVDGCLVGGAALQADEFGGICRFYDMPVL